MSESANNSGCETQPLITNRLDGIVIAKLLSDDYLGKKVRFRGMPFQTLHEVRHSGNGYVTLVIGKHTFTVNEEVRIGVLSEVDGL